MRLHNQLYDQSERYRRLSSRSRRRSANIGDEHQKIMDAVLARDANKAVKLLAQHLGATTAILLDANLEELPAKRRAAPARRVARRQSSPLVFRRAISLFCGIAVSMRA